MSQIELCGFVNMLPAPYQIRHKKIKKKKKRQYKPTQLGVMSWTTSVLTDQQVGYTPHLQLIIIHHYSRVFVLWLVHEQCHGPAKKTQMQLKRNFSARQSHT